MKPYWRVKWVMLGAALLALFAMAAHYFNSLVVVEAKIASITPDPAAPGWREMVLEVKSAYPPWPFVPQPMRAFFSNTPIVCFLTAEGKELVNDDTQSPCVWEEPATAGRMVADSAGFRTSRFNIPFALQPLQVNEQRLFFNSLLKQKGIWIQFKLGGHMFPPPVLAKPMFVPLLPFCRSHADMCQGLWHG